MVLEYTKPVRNRVRVLCISNLFEKRLVPYTVIYMKLPSGKSAYEILIVLIVALLAIYTHAEEPESEIQTIATSTQDEVKNQSEHDASATTSPMEPSPNIREEHRVQLLQRFQDRIYNLARNISSRLTASINRLQNIADRLDTRIAKEKNMGRDTTLAETKLNEAKQSLNEARSKQGELPSVQRVLTSDTPRESFRTVRENFLATRDLLKKAHAQLTETVLLLKNAPAKQAVDEGGTMSTTTEPAE